MPWFIVRGSRIPVADEEVFATEDAAAASARRRYPGSDCVLVEAGTVIDALRLVIDRRIANPARGPVAPRLRVQRGADTSG